MNKGKCKPTSAELSPRSFMIANSVGDEYPTWMQTKKSVTKHFHSPLNAVRVSSRKKIPAL